MKKCDCYCEEPKRSPRYNVYTGKVDYYVEEVSGRCNGTRERDECSCGGDRTQCDFYPDVRDKALKGQGPKFGEWISVKDRLPDKDGKYLVVHTNVLGTEFYISTMKFALNIKKVDKYDFAGHARPGWYDYDSTWGYHEWDNITHWTPLPELPKGE